uniref:Uncharacterized protein n=1 Tax=Tanacetum cinerariifolium TaxID=118510 RepID=A0A6L2JRT6_TANCI|nr:hypothetical protein [Tanacetum cinerariifolium]
MNVPKSILKKVVRNVVNDAHEVVKPSHDGGSASKVSFEAVGLVLNLVQRLMMLLISALNQAAAAKVKGRYDNSILGFFLGKDPSFPVVQQDQVIEKGSWMILKSPIMLSKWSPSVSLKRCEVTKVSVWVKMYNIPVLAYSKDGLSLLATQIGKPIMLDAFTSSTCVESWGRFSFARALIEIDAAVRLKNEVIIAIPEEEAMVILKRLLELNMSGSLHIVLIVKGLVMILHYALNVFVRRFLIIQLGMQRLLLWKKMMMVLRKLRAVRRRKELILGLNTANPFDVLNVNGDDMGESGTQPKVSDHVNSVLDKIKDASKPSSSNSSYGDGHKDKDVSSPPVTSLGGGNQLKKEDFDFYDGYEDQVVDLHGALKEYNDFKLSMSEVVPKVDDVSLVDGVFIGAFGGDGEEDFVMGECVVVSSLSLDMFTKSCLGGMIVSFIFLEGLEEEAWVESMK